MAQRDDLRDRLERETATCRLLRHQLERSESQRQQAEAQVSLYDAFADRVHHRTVRIYDQVLHAFSTPAPQPELLSLPVTSKRHLCILYIRPGEQCEVL